MLKHDSSLQGWAGEGRGYGREAGSGPRDGEAYLATLFLNEKLLSATSGPFPPRFRPTFFPGRP
jgi:hypothetical protein